jgi:hypothetical protein
MGIKTSAFYLCGMDQRPHFPPDPAILTDF